MSGSVMQGTMPRRPGREPETAELTATASRARTTLTGNHRRVPWGDPPEREAPLPTLRTEPSRA